MRPATRSTVNTWRHDMDPVTCTVVTVTPWWPLILYAGMAGAFGLGLITAAQLGANRRDKEDKR